MISTQLSQMCLLRLPAILVVGRCMKYLVQCMAGLTLFHKPLKQGNEWFKIKGSTNKSFFSVVPGMSSQKLCEWIAPSVRSCQLRRRRG